MIHRLAFAFWAPDEDGDDGNVSFPPGEGVEAIILLQRKSKISMAGLLVVFYCFLPYCFYDVMARNFVLQYPQPTKDSFARVTICNFL